MDPWEEPIRGEPLPAAAFTLDGLERLRGWGRYWLPTPMHHLLGVQLSQTVNGSAVMSMPVSPWLMHPDGSVEIGLLADTVCHVAADTVLKPGAIIAPLNLGYRPLRRVREETRALIGRANVIRSSRDWVYVEAQIEDGDGRAVAHASAHAAIRPVTFPLPEQPHIDPVTQPSYATPDPYRRPLPPDKHAAVEMFRDRGLVATFRAIADGGVPPPPLYSLLGIRPVSADLGEITTELVTSGWLRAIDPTDVTAAYLRTHAITTGVAALWSLVPDDHWPAILDYHTVVVGSAPADGRVITARASAERLANDVAVARIETSDAGRRIAVSQVSAHVRPAAAHAVRAPERSLATVLFTDLVGSTESAERLGDEAWAQLLDRHQRLVRARLADHGGREVKTTGDGFVTTFDSPTAAVRCAQAIAEDARRLGCEVRAGIHTGEVERLGGDITGLTVHIAARIEASAEPGEVWVSDTVRSLVSATDLRFEDRGAHALKGVDGEIRLHVAASG